MKRYWVGVSKEKREVFSFDRPDETTHGHLYYALIGPFITKRGAEYMAKFGGNNNVHLQTVKDAEYYSKIKILRKVRKQCDCGKWFVGDIKENQCSKCSGGCNE